MNSINIWEWGNIIPIYKWVNQGRAKFMKVLLDVTLTWITFQKELLMAYLMENMRSCPAGNTSKLPSGQGERDFYHERISEFLFSESSLTLVSQPHIFTSLAALALLCPAFHLASSTEGSRVSQMTSAGYCIFLKTSNWLFEQNSPASLLAWALFIQMLYCSVFNTLFSLTKFPQLCTFSPLYVIVQLVHFSLF